MNIAKLLIPALFVIALPAFAGETSEKSETNADSGSDGKITKDCKFKGQPLKGKVQIVESFPDFKVKQVSSFPDLKVKLVTSFPDDCGEWQIVESFPDFKIQYVDSFPDFKIKMVTSFPGMP
jgi:hypothetical protein